MKLEHTIRIGGKDGRCLRVDAQLARRIDEYGKHLGEQLGAPVSRSFAATILVLKTPKASRVEHTQDASPGDIRKAIRSALVCATDERSARKRALILEVTG